MKLLKDRKTRRFFEGHRGAAFQGFADRATRRLTWLDSAESLTDLIRITAQWRICLRWEDDGPSDVEVVDDHS